MSCSPQILHRRSGHVARNIYRTRDYTRSNREFLITSFLVELTTNVVIVSVVLVLVPGNGMSSNLYNAGVREKKYGGETHVRRKKEKKTKKKMILPASQSIPQTLIPCAPFVVLREKERVYLRSKSIHNENPPAIGDPSIVHRSVHTHMCTRRTDTHAHVTPSETQRSFFRFPPSCCPDASLSFLLFSILFFLSSRRARQRSAIVTVVPPCRLLTSRARRDKAQTSRRRNRSKSR